MSKEFYYQESEFLNSEFNITFEELLYKNEEEMTQWFDDLRDYLASLLNAGNFQPSKAYSKEEIIEQFKTLNNFNDLEDKGFLCKDDSDGETNVLRNFQRLCPATKQFFPNMVKVNYAGTHSFMDYCTKDNLRETFHTQLWRNFRYDSYYSINGYACKNNISMLNCSTGIEWVRKYAKDSDYNSKVGFWVFENYNKKRRPYYGKDGDILTLSKEEIELLVEEGTLISEKHLTNYKRDPKKLKKNPNPAYEIKIFNFGQKIFPAFYDAFRTGLGQNPTVFAESRAKYLLYKFSRHIPVSEEPIVYYDPSCGWGNRLLGAISQKRKFHYVGTDPNTDNLIPELGISKYEYLGNFFNKNVRVGNAFFGGKTPDKNTFHIFQDPAEEIGDNPDFQQYKGKIDLVFTSPPYFNKEQYSQDETQSWKKHGDNYPKWRDGFLRPSLKTACECLKEDRYLLYNIADVRDGKKLLPLEDDSIKACEENGLIYEGKIKMALGKMAGQADIEDSTGLRGFKNICVIEGKEFKYEPILIFYKPSKDGSRNHNWK